MRTHPLRRSTALSGGSSAAMAIPYLETLPPSGSAGVATRPTPRGEGCRGPSYTWHAGLSPSAIRRGSWCAPPWLQVVATLGHPVWAGPVLSYRSSFTRLAPDPAMIACLPSLAPALQAEGVVLDAVAVDRAAVLDQPDLDAVLGGGLALDGPPVAALGEPAARDRRFGNGSGAAGVSCAASSSTRSRGILFFGRHWRSKCPLLSTWSRSDVSTRLRLWHGLGGALGLRTGSWSASQHCRGRVRPVR